MTLSGTTTPSQNGPWSDGYKEVLRIPQSSSITGALPSDCLVLARCIKTEESRFGFFVFYDISTFVGNLMPKPFS